MKKSNIKTGVIAFVLTAASMVQVAQAQWSLTGNAGTTPGTNFVGTTDTKSLYFKTNSTTKMVITSGGKVGIGTSSPTAKFQVNGGNAQINGTSIGIGGGAPSWSNAFGTEALSGNTTGDENTAVGWSALKFNSTGSRNTACGTSALTINTIGTDNTAFGKNALGSNTTGTDNTAVGSKSQQGGFGAGSYNTSVGSGANYVGGCTGNTSIGRQSNYNINWTQLCGNYNTSVGMASGGANYAGNNNTHIGAYATNFGSPSINNSTGLGYQAQTDADNKVMIGNASVTSIGGQVAWTSFSDARIKDNVQENVHGLDFINQLRPVTFHYNVDKQYEITGVKVEEDWASRKDVEKIAFSGFLAQEVDAAAKKISYDFSGVDKSGKLLGLRYSEFTVPLVKAVQELSKQNAELKNEIAEMKALFEFRSQDAFSKIGSSEINAQDGLLFQNQPNPFNQSTAIRYQLSGDARGGAIVIRDLGGNLVKSIEVSGSGKGQVMVNANELAAGTYTYTLEAAGKSFDTKLMVVTK